MKKCPFCGEEVQDAAIKCKHCKEWLQKRPESQPVIDSQRQEFGDSKPTMSTTASSKKNTMPPGPVGVGGWLMLLVILMIIGPLMGAANINRGFMSAEQQNPAIKTLAQWNTYKFATWGVFFAFAALNFYGALGLARGKDWSVVRRAKIIWWISGPLVTIVIGFIIPSAIFGVDVVDPVQLIGGLIASLIAAGIWTAYLSKSMRVCNTYGGIISNYRETWFSKHSRGLAVLIISIPVIGIIAAIAIPGYLGMQERAHKAQNELAPAPVKGDIFDQINPGQGPAGQAPRVEYLGPLDSSAPAPKPPDSAAPQPQTSQSRIPWEDYQPIEDASSQFLDKFARLVPDWQTIKDDPKFLEWLHQTDTNSRKTRYDHLAEASASNNAESAASFYIRYKNEARTNILKEGAKKSQAGGTSNKLREESTPTMQKWVDEKGNVHYSGATGEGQ